MTTRARLTATLLGSIAAAGVLGAPRAAPPVLKPLMAAAARQPAIAPPRGAALMAPGAGGGSDIRVGVTGAGGRVRVTTLEMEEYVARVVAAEGEANAAEAAQQALAIAVRTFAAANVQRHRRDGYDLCDTTHCQVMGRATASSRRAADATTGRVLVRDGRIASVFYSASCGGRSEVASAIWPGAIDHPARSQRDEACEGQPQWSSELPVGVIERALREAGHRGSRLRDLRVVDRNSSDRVARLRVDGFTPSEISGHDFRMAVGRVAGWQQIKSTAFDVRRAGPGYRFSGRGFGHGVGLCVIGAGRRAAAGTGAQEILEFYFPQLRVEPRRSPAVTSTGPAREARASGTDRPPDVLLALPATEEKERASAIRAIRAARDEIAAAAGVRPPASIRVIVHPTVESFGRATGQPWWVSGATEGSSIDLLPLAILQQRAQLERTVRHEVAHVLLDGALAGRPLWVREGAALYFAGPPESRNPGDVPPPGRGGCPADGELLRPASAGAHRAAVARADACFRRAIARGTRWSDVR